MHIRLYEFISHGKGNPKASVDPQSQARRNHPGLLPTGHKALRGFMAPAANQLFGPPRHANKILRPATCLCPLLPAKRRRSAVVAAYYGPYRSCNAQTLCRLHLRRHKRATRPCLAGEQAGAGEEEGKEDKTTLKHGQQIASLLVCFPIA